MLYEVHLKSGVTMQAQTLLLIRSSSLTLKEAKALPRTFQAVMGSHPVIARADVSLSAKEVVGLAVQAGRILFDAEVVFHERIAPISGSLIPLDQYIYAMEHAQPSGSSHVAKWFVSPECSRKNIGLVRSSV